MSEKKALSIFCAAVLLVFLLLNVSHASLINGDFSSGLEGWVTEDDFSSSPSLSVSAAHGYAILSTQGISDGAFLISLYQQISIPEWAYTLSFDIGFENVRADTGGSSGGFVIPDFMQVSYLDNLDNDFNRNFLAIDSTSPYDPDSLEELSLPSFSLYDLTWYHFSAVISDLAGSSGTLYFDLWDGDDDWFSMAYVDNVRINPVPEPATILLLGAGLAGLGGFVRKKKRTLQN
jgi:hypothetical protein